MKKTQKHDSLSMRHRASTFTFAATFLPTSIRHELEQLYSFCRYVDDCVDSCEDKKAATAAIAQVIYDLQSESSQIKEVAQFLQLAESRNIPISLALDLALGVQADLPPVVVPNQEELLRYCYRVAATVGTMICYLLDVTSPGAIVFGVDLGIAMQLTNITRDVAEDFVMQRVYMPADLLKPETLDRAIFLRDPLAQKEVSIAVAKILKLADKYYLSAEEGICYLPASTRLGILTAGRAYRKIGSLILNSPKKYFQSRVSSSLLDKQLCLATAFMSLLLDRKFTPSNKLRTHERDLHNSLHGLASFDFIFS
jgi:phytoene synthase